MPVLVTVRSVTALGAKRSDVIGMVLGHGLAIAAVGGLLGILLSAVAARFLDAMLYEVSLFDPVLIGGIAGLIGVVSVLASLLPALRATRIDPMGAMRSE